MGVASGWVGSSAVSVTGERSMKSAGAKLKLSTPFYMSQMVGKSVQDFSITVGRSNFVVLVQATNIQIVPVNNKPLVGSKRLIQKLIYRQIAMCRF